MNLLKNTVINLKPGQRNPIVLWPLVGIVAVVSSLISGCAFVPQANREYLSDPIMLRQADGLEGSLEGHDFPRREGSVGGSSGSGGGCGC